MSRSALNRKGATGIAGAFALLGLIAYWNWGPKNIRWLPQPRGFHDSPSATWLFADEWTSENGYAAVESITYIGSEQTRGDGKLSWRTEKTQSSTGAATIFFAVSFWTSPLSPFLMTGLPTAKDYGPQKVNHLYNLTPSSTTMNRCVRWKRTGQRELVYTVLNLSYDATGVLSTIVHHSAVVRFEPRFQTFQQEGTFAVFAASQDPLDPREVPLAKGEFSGQGRRIPAAID